MCELNRGGAPALPSPQRFFEKGPEKRVELLWGAMVGVERNPDARFAGDLMRQVGERPRSDRAIANGGARHVCRTAGRQLDDPVGLGLGKSAERRVQRLR